MISLLTLLCKLNKYFPSSRRHVRRTRERKEFFHRFTTCNESSDDWLISAHRNKTFVDSRWITRRMEWELCKKGVDCHAWWKLKRTENILMQSTWVRAQNGRLATLNHMAWWCITDVSDSFYFCTSPLNAFDALKREFSCKLQTWQMIIVQSRFFSHNFFVAPLSLNASIN